MKALELYEYLPFGVNMEVIDDNDITEEKLDPFLLNFVEEGIVSGKPYLRRPDDLLSPFFSKEAGEQIKEGLGSYWDKPYPVLAEDLKEGRIPLKVYKFLLKNHFDLFGLIEKEKAIKIELIQTIPYNPENNLK